MQNAEIELKFPIDDLLLLESRLPGLGFHLETPRSFEQNTLYDTPSRDLRQARQILRLRHYANLWTLTHKRPSSSRDSDQARYKVRIETETLVEDGPSLGAIFEQMGYAPVFRYEKFRTIWSQSSGSSSNALPISPLIATGNPLCSTCHLVIDETPIGAYAELEGAPEWIDRTLAALGVDPATCITDSYGRLFLSWKERTGSPVDHLTFDLIPAPELLQPALR